MYYKRLRGLREDSDRSQAELAAIIGTTQQQYSRWESGAREVPVHILILLALHYKVSVDYMLGLTDTPRTPDGKPYDISRGNRR